MGKPGVLAGASAGGLLTAPLVAILYLGWRIAGLPFAPFDVFDWLARKLPGAVITFGIDAMIKVIRALHVGSTAAVAKTAEQIMAVGIFLVSGVLAGALLFSVLKARERGALVLAPALGAATGVGALLIGQSLGRPNALPPVMCGLWTLAVFTAWGLTLGWAFRRMNGCGRPAGGPADGTPTRVERIDRRRFLIRLGSASAVITVAGAMVSTLLDDGPDPGGDAPQRWSAGHELPNAKDPVRPAPGTRPELTPLERHYRIDINTTPPVVRGEDWRLKVGGLVEEPLELTLDEIRRYPSTDLFVTLACISNPVAGDLIGTTRWTGLSLQRLLPDLKLKPSATHLKINSVDGFFETVALETIARDERVMLAYSWDGLPLAAKHGFPLRIYIPDRYGMKQPKWIASMEAVDAWEAGYWVVRGWDKEARMKATSVIDTVAVKAAFNGPGGERLVPVGGIAHAGARGISKVEVRLDNGAWRDARLRSPLSGLTWVVWRYDLPFEPGEHTLTVRCAEGDGTPQTVELAPPHFSGATGLHVVNTKI